MRHSPGTPDQGPLWIAGGHESSGGEPLRGDHAEAAAILPAIGTTASPPKSRSGPFNFMLWFHAKEAARGRD